jgi:hypothetical protein
MEDVNNGWQCLLRSLACRCSWRSAMRNMPLVLETHCLSTFIHSLTNFTFIYVPDHTPLPPPPHINSHYLLPYVFVSLQFVFLILTSPNLLFSIFYVFSSLSTLLLGPLLLVSSLSIFLYFVTVVIPLLHVLLAFLVNYYLSLFFNYNKACNRSLRSTSLRDPRIIMKMVILKPFMEI